ncbi:MAG TPA: class II aldolase/adducin family protein [Anaerolineaceae bacterium]|nr:class II aldolase/adducin family protein [Anaerolineaceae bacterium]HQP08972.1 class II aldolase/adducin family protein [Anaerolineaceae bacterium]
MKFQEIVLDMGRAGQQVTDLGAAEGAAGNISVFTRHLEDVPESYQETGTISLPTPALALTGGWVVITGTGKRLRDITVHPEKTVTLVQVLADGLHGKVFSASELRPTSEFNSHLGIHEDQVARRGIPYLAVIHAQSRHMAYLSHLPEYSDTYSLNRRLLRWEPETVITFPEGFGMIPFEVPGTEALRQATVEGLRSHKLVIWQRHGQVARSDESVSRAADYIEYSETAAAYEYLNLSLGSPVEGISVRQILDICAAFNIDQHFFKEDEG